MSSGITSASTASRAFAANFANAFDLDLGEGILVSIVALAFMALVAIVNFRGVGVPAGPAALTPWRRRH